MSQVKITGFTGRRIELFFDHAKRKDYVGTSSIVYRLYNDRDELVGKVIGPGSVFDVGEIEIKQEGRTILSMSISKTAFKRIEREFGDGML